MPIPQKACPFVLRHLDSRPQALAFQHPLAGKQWVKGTIKSGEDPHSAARRELHEESGLIAPARMIELGTVTISEPHASWHLFAFVSNGLPETWDHETHDDHGHTFRFFWHPVDTSLDADWHPQFHPPFSTLLSALANGALSGIESLENPLLR